MKNPFRYGSRVSGRAFFDLWKIMRDMLGVISSVSAAVVSMKDCYDI
ncbi:MAG: hypothetical protein IKO55_12700 [Kiritimatiellae bacterium]|nr:hypothetical protein [Kiritimatiellia bacterium]